jgi:putative flavoprotein involved in K+ transport
MTRNGPLTSGIEGLIEEGEAFNTLRAETRRERVDVLVVGAGQAGLSVGYHLKKLGLEFVIVDANARVGDSWRQRWDSLRLFTPNRFNGLDGMPFPGPRYGFPTKDEMGDFLESYAAHFQLPVLPGVRVQRLWREGARYVVDAGSRQFEADHVVVAMASYQGRKVPAFAKELSPNITQLHSSEYKSLAQLKPGGVLIVGLRIPVRRSPWKRRRHIRPGSPAATSVRCRSTSGRPGCSASSFRFSSASCFIASSQSGRRWGGRHERR